MTLLSRWPHRTHACHPRTKTAALRSPLPSVRRTKASREPSVAATLRASAPSPATPRSVSLPLPSRVGFKSDPLTLRSLALPAAQLVQGRLSGLIGRSSGYVESLPTAVQYRLTALKGVQRDHSALEAEFQREIFELEKRFAEKYRPLYERRRAIIEGKDEPTEDEIKKGVEVEEEEEDDEDSDFEDEEDVDDEDDEEREKPKKERGVKPSDEELAQAPKGIPEFWLTTLKNHLGLSELITERDEDALRHLVDIRVAYPSDNRSGFTLVFEFGEGAKQFFENTKLEKTYYYQDEVGYEGDFVYDHAEGTKIEWKEGKDLTVKIETKKQRNKSELFLIPGPFRQPVLTPLRRPHPSQTPTRRASSRRWSRPTRSSPSSTLRNLLRPTPTTRLTTSRSRPTSTRSSNSTTRSART